MRDKLIEFMDSIRDYVAESGTNIANDERDSSEFVDIFLNQGQSLPIDSVSFSLPTDDEIIEKHNSLKTVHGEVLKHTKDKFHRIGFYRGARWMRELISNES